MKKHSRLIENCLLGSATFLMCIGFVGLFLNGMYPEFLNVIFKYFGLC